MGIPHFFRYVRTRFPGVVREVHAHAAPPTRGGSTRRPPHHDHGHGKGQGAAADIRGCHSLYLDFNCVVHNCARVVVEEEEGGDPPLCEEDLWDRVIQASCAYVQHLEALVQPHHLLYIAVDGVPPRAKMVQQRSRRYLSAQWGRARAPPETDADTDAAAEPAATPTEAATRWDSTCVTPGTLFMERLCAALHAFAARHNTSASAPRIVVSDSTEPMEGEQKIMKELRRLRAADAPEEAEGGLHVVYGMDADLVILGCLATVPGIRVLRPLDEQKQKQRQHPQQLPPARAGRGYALIDVDRFRQELHASVIRSCAGPMHSAREFSVLCSLLGNDFVPGLACLRIRDGGVDELVQAYHDAAAAAPGGGLALTPPLPLVPVPADAAALVDMDALARVLEVIAAREDALMCKVDAEYYRRCRFAQAPAAQRRPAPPHPPRGPNKQPANGDDTGSDYPLTHAFPDIIRPRQAGWRLRYYHYLFGGHSDGRTIHEVCRNFVESVVWSLANHADGPLRNGRLSSSWYYRYPYAPTALDLVNYIAATKGRPRDFEAVFSGADVLPSTIQLLVVLPPAALRHVPDPKARLLATSLAHGCAHLFPTGFRVLTYLKYHLSDCPPLLPDVDVPRLRAAYERAAAC